MSGGSITGPSEKISNVQFTAEEVGCSIFDLAPEANPYPAAESGPYQS